jgi:hypothetical protein
MPGVRAPRAAAQDKDGVAAAAAFAEMAGASGGSVAQRLEGLYAK